MVIAPSALESARPGLMLKGQHVSSMSGMLAGERLSALVSVAMVRESLSRSLLWAKMTICGHGDKNRPDPVVT